MQWSVSLELTHDTPPPAMEDIVDDLLEELKEYAAVASYGHGRVGLRLTVNATSIKPSVNRALAAVIPKLRKHRIHITSVVSIEAETMEELERRLAEPAIPEVVGVQELAAMLHVSKQRASELARAESGFPKPIQTLASGPVWIKPSILRYVESWVRRPSGRPRKDKNHGITAQA